MVAVAGAHAGLTYTIRIAAPLTALASERSALMETLAIGLSMALLLAGVGGWIIGRQALRPLVAMAQETSAMTTLTPDERVTVPRARDELAQLGQAFNGLLDRLDAAMSTQRQFMADASHELRTPVSVTRTAAQVTLGREHRTEQEYRESLTIVAEQAERLTRMVDDMFLLARADAHARPIDATAIYLGELVDECTRAVRVLAEERGVDVRALGEQDVPFVGDENLLRQLLVNLLENGVAHTPPGGRVTAKLRTDRGFGGNRRHRFRSWCRWRRSRSHLRALRSPGPVRRTDWGRPRSADRALDRRTARRPLDPRVERARRSPVRRLVALCAGDGPIGYARAARGRPPGVLRPIA